MNSQQTRSTKQEQIQNKWHVVDVKDKVLGRVASDIAHLLRGKSKTYFVPNMDCGDSVVVINAAHIATTGNKELQKTYTRYSGYPDGLKSETAGRLRARKPAELVRRAVAGMLPKNKLRDRWLAKLHIFSEATHTFQKQINSEQ